MPTSILNFPTSAEIGVVFSPVPSFSGAALNGTLRVQDLTSGFDSGVFAYSGTSGTISAALDPPTGNHSIRVTFGNGEIFNYTIIAYYFLLSSSVNTGGTGYSAGTFTLTRNTALTPFKPVNITGGDGTITYTLTGTLPAGLSYSSSTGNLSGTPTVIGTTSFSVAITDSSGQSTSQSFGITVILSTSTVSVPIQSYIGFKRPDGAAVGGYSAPRPVLQTTETLDGATFAVTGATANSKMLYVPPLTTFTYFPNTTSTAQTVTVINSGTQAVSLIGTTSTDYETKATVNIGVLPASIPPGGSYTFNLSYYSDVVGEYAESLILLSNADSPYYRIDTLQNVISVFNFRASPTSATFTTTVLGLTSSTSIELTPIINGVDDVDTVLSFSAALTGSPGWKYTTGTNIINLTWDPDYVGNINNTTTGYTSTLAISVLGAGSTTISNTAYINIDYTKYRNLSTWISPAAGNNSIIGISFDIFDGVKTVTIGVGAGGDGTPIYSEGGNIFAVMNNLKIGAGSIDTPYPYWSNVFSIPLPEAGTYLSGDLDSIGLPKYIKKTTDGLNYADYFGFEQSVGSMFIVTYNGYDLVNIDINNLRELSGDTTFDLTMENLTRAFHYYSAVDNPTRYYQLEAARLNDPRTRLFRGFVATSFSPETWIVDTSLVPLPN